MIKKNKIKDNQYILVVLKNNIFPVSTNQHIYVKKHDDNNYELRYGENIVLDIYDHSFENLSAKDAANTIFNKIKNGILKGKKVIDLSEY